MSQDINKIIDQLAEIDSASARIMQQSQNEKAKYAEYINQQKQQFDNELQKEVDAAVLEYEKQMDEQIKAEIEECRTNCDNDIKKLSNMFTTNGSDWANDIFNNIIKE
jgi:predicted transcriptional regulator